MVGTYGEGMEETDGGVLDLVAIRCCRLMVHQCRCASLSLVVVSPGHVVVVLCCCPCAMSLSLACCGPILCLNEVCWGEVGEGVLTLHQQ